MFDSKKILDALIQGAVAPQGGQQGGGLGGLLGQVLGGAGQQGAQGQQGGAGGLGDLLGQVLGGAQNRQAAPSQPGSAGGLGDLLGQVLGGAGQQGGAAGGLGGLLGGLLGGQQAGAGQQQAGPGGIGDLLGSLLGQATGGARDAAQSVDAATGATDKLSQLIEQATGKKLSPDMMSQVRDMIEQNQLGAGAVAGGLGGLLLGTKSGRSITATAAKLGGLALIGGLAYKAYQNYLEGKPLIQLGEPVAAPPRNSAFNPNAGDPQQNATLMLRGMIAAAAADGKIDENEKKAIFGQMQAIGAADKEAIAFLNNEIANPADAATLAAEVQGPEQATALYTACTLAINVDTRAEQRFMLDLAESLGLEESLVEQIEAATASVRAA